MSDGLLPACRCGTPVKDGPKEQSPAPPTSTTHGKREASEDTELRKEWPLVTAQRPKPLKVPSFKQGTLEFYQKIGKRISVRPEFLEHARSIQWPSVASPDRRVWSASSSGDNIADFIDRRSLSSYTGTPVRRNEEPAWTCRLSPRRTDLDCAIDGALSTEALWSISLRPLR